MEPWNLEPAAGAGVQPRMTATSALVVALAAVAAPPPATQPTRQQLEQRIAELEATVAKLEEALEPVAPPINLARTSLAEVAASDVNGGRSLLNPFYGVRNAFDGGEHWINNINYTYWLSGGSAGWIDVYFLQPVTVRAASINGAAATMRVFGENGGEFTSVNVEGRTDLDDPVHGVTSVRFEFDNAVGNLRVNDIHVLGDPPPDVEPEIRTPNVRITRGEVMVTAQDAYREWLRQSLTGTPRLEEDDDAWVVTFTRDGLEVFRIRIDKSDQAVTEQALVELRPKADAGE